MMTTVLEGLKNIVGEDRIISDSAQVSAYIKDETEEAIAPVPCFDCIVCKPETVDEVSQILKLANELEFPVIARGGATGCAGAVVPIKPSVIMLMERFDKIINVDEDNMLVECEAGVTLAQLEETFAKHDSLFFPAHPGDEGAQVGGMVVQNAGGVRAVKHGVMRSHVKGLEIVLPTGEVINSGGKLLKHNTGFDFTHLMIGSEGTLGVVTKAILKIYPKTENSSSLIVSFEDKQGAFKAVPKVLSKGLQPLAIEYLERDFMEASAKDLGLEWPAKKGSVDLYFLLDEKSEDELYAVSEQIVEICEANGAVDSLIAETAREQREILEIRSHGYPSVKHMVVDILDTAVPISAISDFMNGLDDLADKYGAKIPSFGHAGDGNIHNFIMTPDGTKPENYDALLEDIFKLAIGLGGTITAEHGVGKIRNNDVKLQFSKKELELMHGIKKLFDPKNILNPGTALDLLE